ncbi:hypothetical protein CH333_03260 [candidate division WOR-3 bacterium JGI_Cruoil_03_44_89]|uniref:Uncharacterized protein n=1 Tax=candidate division WOR-3 bacterium JGI_Cruoil_03_44_89 TaxID=1973748 RepID=A0A235BWI4_UNCW3|nr:MAG: hypothetical protein CH333_03260 [candidate division WOR-3 bacterium JGI_Cruoil_03_44_89]
MDITEFQSSFVSMQKEFENIKIKDINTLERNLKNLKVEIIKAKLHNRWFKSNKNIFEIAGATNELIHSNIIGWLLDPWGSHRLGTKFISKFLSKVEEYHRNDKMLYNQNFDRWNKRDKDGIALWKDINNSESLKNVEITREEEASEAIPDIVIKGCNWRCVIENKISISSIKQGEGKNQSSRIRRSFRSAILIYLSPYENLQEGIEISFIHVTYNDILTIISDLATEIKDTEIQKIIRDYESIVRDVIKGG